MKALIAILVLGLSANLVFADGEAGADEDRVIIRQVVANNDGKGVGKGLADVSKLLSKNLPFTNFKLLSRRSLTLPQAGKVVLKDGYACMLNGTVKDLSVTVLHGRKKLHVVTVELKRNKPLILAGFPHANGKVILILQYQPKNAAQ